MQIPKLWKGSIQLVTAKCRWNVGEAVEMSPKAKWLLREGLKEQGLGIFRNIWRMLGRWWRMISKLSYETKKGWMKWESGLLYVDMRMNWTWFKGVHLMLSCVQSWVMQVWVSLAACLYILEWHRESWLRIWLCVSGFFLKHMYLTMVLCFRSSKGLCEKLIKCSQSLIPSMDSSTSFITSSNVSSIDTRPWWWGNIPPSVSLCPYHFSKV